VPPPEFVSGGENATLADHVQVTEPGAAPENLGGLLLAATGEAVIMVTPMTVTRIIIGAKDRSQLRPIVGTVLLQWTCRCPTIRNPALNQ
jgi:hypothetical protein